MPEEKLVSVKYLIEYYGLTRQTFDRWREDGLPCRKIGRSVRFSFTEVDEWIKENKKC